VTIVFSPALPFSSPNFQNNTFLEFETPQLSQVTGCAFFSLPPGLSPGSSLSPLVSHLLFFAVVISFVTHGTPPSPCFSCHSRHRSQPGVRLDHHIASKPRVGPPPATSGPQLFPPVSVFGTQSCVLFWGNPPPPVARTCFSPPP